MTDQTAEARMNRAVKVVREQRDPNGEYGAIGDPVHGFDGVTAVEAFAIQELERLQRAVMGEPDV